MAKTQYGVKPDNFKYAQEPSHVSSAAKWKQISLHCSLHLSTRAGTDCVGHAIPSHNRVESQFDCVVDGVGAHDHVCASMLAKLVEVPKTSCAKQWRNWSSGSTPSNLTYTTEESDHEPIHVGCAPHISLWRVGLQCKRSMSFAEFAWVKRQTQISPFLRRRRGSCTSSMGDLVR